MRFSPSRDFEILREAVGRAEFLKIAAACGGGVPAPPRLPERWNVTLPNAVYLTAKCCIFGCQMLQFA
jgi:hypothetical protein